MAQDLSAADIRVLETVAQAMRLGNTRQAAALADTSIADGFRHPLLFHARAVWLSEQGQYERSLAELEKADALSMPNATIKNAMGICLARLDRLDDAIRAFEDAVALQPNNAQLYSRQGWVHELAEDLTAARRAHERAIELKPDYAEPLGRLAFLAARRGDWPNARTYAARALATDAHQPAAQLALVTADVEKGTFADAEQRLSALLAEGKLTGGDRYIALGLLGDLRDRQNRVGEAFACYARANDEARRLRASRFSSATMNMLEAARDLCAWFETAPPLPYRKTDALHSAGETSHVFLIGFPRSGTTLLEQVLAGHPDVVSLEERDTLGDAARAFLTQPQDIEKLAAASDETLASHRELYWSRVRKFGAEPEGKVFVDKTPINTVKLPLIAGLFPDAKIVFALRDPRDVVLSCFRRRFETNATTWQFLTLESTARFYDAVMRLADLYRAKLPIEIHDIRHEELVADFDGRTRELCSFIGLGWDPALRNFSERPGLGAISTPSSTQLARGLNRDGVGQWRRYSEQIAPVLPVLREWVERFGYPPQ